MFSPKFILLSVCKDLFFQKKSCKMHVLMTFCSGLGKIVLVLLNKLVAFYIRSTIIQVRVFGFEWPI